MQTAAAINCLPLSDWFAGAPKAATWHPPFRPPPDVPVQTYIDANGQGHADGAGSALVFIGGLILLGVLIYPAGASLAIRMVYTLVRRARA